MFSLAKTKRVGIISRTKTELPSFQLSVKLKANRTNCIMWLKKIKIKSEIGNHLPVTVKAKTKIKNYLTIETMTELKLLNQSESSKLGTKTRITLREKMRIRSKIYVQNWTNTAIQAYKASKLTVHCSSHYL